MLSMRAITLVITILLSALTACSPPSKVDPHERRAYNNNGRYNGRVEYTVPNYWHGVSPSVPMRIDEYEISDPQLKQSAVMAVYVFPGDAGGVDSNISRWKAQFKNDSYLNVGREEQFNLGDMPITTITISGTYLKPTDMMDPKSHKVEMPNQAITTAIVELRDQVWFFKLIGDTELVHNENKNFNKMIDSFTLKLQ